jgi:alanine racemase
MAAPVRGARERVFLAVSRYERIEAVKALWRPTVAHIDLSAIKDNIAAIRARVGPHVMIMPAVKANGYGHGAIQVGRACLEAGVEALCVSCIEEAVELREAGIDAPLLILGCSSSSSVEPILDHAVTSTVCDLPFARALSDAAAARGARAPVHVKIDTGMGRIGIPAAGAVEFIESLCALPGLSVEGVFTHFPSADEEDRSFTSAQIETFGGILGALRDRGIHIKTAHASNSGGILSYREADFDAVRPGIMIYGLYPSPTTPRSIPLREALTLKTRIVFLKTAPAGTPVSYGRTHVLKRESMVATIPIGYADGYPRSLSNLGEAAVRGVRVPIVGRVCMDQCVIDVTGVPDVGVDDEVILYGGGFDYLSLSAIAEKIGTISYELLCAISPRVRREYS